MTDWFGSAVSMSDASGRSTWSQARLLIVALTAAAIGLSSCGDDGGARGERSVAPNSASRLATSVAGHREPILIKTRVHGFAGDVLAGSVIGDSPFCLEGTVRHEHGSPEIGFPAVNVFRCTNGDLKIGFGPGPDQMNNVVQTSDWKILGGSGRFAGASGRGRMTVRWESAGSSKGQETFRGVVTVP
jgi:hypothetical protein